MTKEMIKEVLKGIFTYHPDILEAFKQENWGKLDYLLYDSGNPALIRTFYTCIYDLDVELLNDILIDLEYIPTLMFNNALNVEAFIIPQGVKIIKNNAFQFCPRLAHITIPNSVTSIGHYAFGTCKRLEDVVIPESVTYIDRTAFEFCFNLNLKLPLKFKLAVDIYRDCKSIEFY